MPAVRVPPGVTVGDWLSTPLTASQTAEATNYTTTVRHGITRGANGFVPCAPRAGDARCQQRARSLRNARHVAVLLTRHIPGAREPAGAADHACRLHDFCRTNVAYSHAVRARARADRDLCPVPREMDVSWHATVLHHSATTRYHPMARSGQPLRSHCCRGYVDVARAAVTGCS